MTVIIVAPYE